MSQKAWWITAGVLVALVGIVWFVSVVFASTGPGHVIH